MAENVAFQEMTAAEIAGLVCRCENTAEREFLIERHGTLVPIEIKSGWVTQAKSLKVFCGEVPCAASH